MIFIVFLSRKIFNFLYLNIVLTTYYLLLYNLSKKYQGVVNVEKPAISSDIIRGHIDTIILHVLSTGDKFPQQISDEIDKKSENEYQINQATLYSSLKRLETNKLVTSYLNDSDVGRRKFFKITSKGSELLNENYASWPTSKKLIDKLMDIKENPITNTIFVTHNDTKNNNEKSKDLSITKSIDNTVKIDKSIITESTIVSDIKQGEIEENSDKSFNFRNVLNSLILESRKNLEKDNPPLEVLSSITPKEEKIEKEKFNDVIDNVTENSQQKNTNIGKIDYSDLFLMSKNDGFKIRISTKDSYKSVGNFYDKKLAFFSMLTLFALCIIQFLPIYITFGNVIFNNVFPIIFVLASVIVTSATFIFFLINKKHTSPNIINNEKIKTSAIISFNLTLVTYALVLLFSVNLRATINIINYLLFPFFIYFDIVLYFVIEKLLYKTNFFRIESK